MAQLQRELALEAPAPVVAYRGARRWLPQVVPLRLEAELGVAGAARLRQGGVYLITGGLGGIGLTLAQALAQPHTGVLFTTRGDPRVLAP